MIMAVDTTLNELIINKISKEQYEQLIAENKVNENELYITDENNSVPTKLSELTNDTGFITSSSVPTKVSELENDSKFITIDDVNIKSSEIENDAGFITSADIPTKLSELTNDTGFVTNETVYNKDEVDNLLSPKATTEYVDSEIDKIEESITNNISSVNTRIDNEVKDLEDAIDLKADKSFIGDASIVIKKNNTSIGTFTTNQTSNTEINIDVPTKLSELTNDKNYQTDTDVSNISNEIKELITEEETKRTTSDNTLQSQIDAINARKDVIDIIPTYEELSSYPTTDLTDKDIIKVIDDSSHNNTSSYFRWDNESKEWNYVGSEAATYTKAESDERFAPKSITINGQPLSSNVSLSYEDVNALPNTTKYSRALSVSGQQLSLEDQEGNVLSTITTQDTTYTAGTGIEINENNQIINTKTSNWGEIEGDLSNQTDLQETLNLKADKSELPTKVSELENDIGYVTQDSVSESLSSKQDVLTPSDGITIEDNVISTVVYQAGENIVFEKVTGKKVGNTSTYYNTYAGDLYENENSDLVILKNLGLSQQYLRTTSYFGNSYDLNDFINVNGNLKAFNIKFKLTQLPIIDDTYSSLFGGAYNTFPKTNIKINYNVTSDTVTLIQEYYEESNDSHIIINTYVIENASSKLLNQWVNFSLYKEDSVWKIDVDNLGVLTAGENNNYDLGITYWGYIFICNAYSLNNNQSSENGYFVYDLDLSETGIYDENGLVLGFCSEETTNTINISTSVNIPTKVSELENDSNYISNTATGDYSLTIGGTSTKYIQSTNIGDNSKSLNYSTALGTRAEATGNASVAIGRKARATDNNAIALGVSAEANAVGAIALGPQAKNNEAKTFKVSLTDTNDSVPAVDESTGLYTLIDATGHVPDTMLPDTIARTSQVDLKADKSDTYTKAEVDAKVSSVYRFKGSVANYDSLPTENLVIGDVYNIESDGSNYAWDGVEWDKLSETINLTPYLTKEEASSTYVTANSYNEFTSEINNNLSTKADKSEIPTVPTKVSELENDANYLTEHQDISGKADKVDTYTKSEVDELVKNSGSSPDQTGNDGKFLSTNGSETSWKYASVLKKDGVEAGLSQLVINNITQEEYDELLKNDQVNESELYIINDEYTNDEIVDMMDSKISKTDFDALLARVEALESITGTISSSLDDINGEVI